MLGPTKSRALDRPIIISLESLVPADHFYRHLEKVLDLAFVRDCVKGYYAERGRPSLDPVVFFKLELVLYLEGLRSERQLMRLAADRLSIRWYLGYGLDEPLPDHSSLTHIRERFGLEVFRRFFDAIVQQCVDAGLVWGTEVFVDATKVQANASLDSVKPRFVVDEHLRNLFADTEPDGAAVDGQTTCEQHSQARSGENVDSPDPVHQAVPVDLAEQNIARHDWIVEEGRPDRDVQHHDYQRVSDFRMSTTDPGATLMRAEVGAPVQLGYHDHYVVDGGNARIILNVLVTPSEVMENQPLLDLLWQTCFRWHVLPGQVTGDTTYGTVENIVALDDAGIRAYVPLPNFEERTPYFGSSRFTYDTEHDIYHCPEGQVLRRRKIKYTENRIEYRGDAKVCNACPLKAQCTASEHGRMIMRSLYEDYLNRVRASHQTEPYRKAMRKRKVWVEPLFAEGKLWHNLRRFRLRQLRRVNIEAVMIAGAQNLKRLLTWRGRRQRPASSMASPIPPHQERLVRSLLPVLGAQLLVVGSYG